MPIIRADMSVRIVCKSGREFEEIQLRFESDLKVAVTSAPQLSSTKDVVYFDLSIEPDKFKRMEQLVHDITLGSGRVEVLQLKSTATLTKDEGVVKDMDALELESMNVTTESAETSPREKVEVFSSCHRLNNVCIISTVPIAASICARSSTNDFWT
jgi:hypothetical protein